MADTLLVEVFCEDVRQEEMARALVARITREERLRVAVEVRCGAGGRGATLREFDAYQQLRRLLPGGPDLLAILVDCDDKSWHATKQDIEDTVDATVFPRVVVACPDPHIESWYLADVETFVSVTGVLPPPTGTPKERLEAAVRAPLTVRDGLELARDLMEEVDLHRAARSCPSLKHAISDFRAQVRQLVLAAKGDV